MAGRHNQFSWAPFWQFQQHRWRQFDSWSCIAKLMILCANVVKLITCDPEHNHLRAAAQFSALLAFVIVAATLWLMRASPQLYLRYRQHLLLLHWAVVGVMILVGFPMLVGAKVPPQSLLARVRLLPLLFKTGAIAPIMAAVMNRLPWQHVALMCSLFVGLVSLVWTRQYCLQVSDAQDARLLAGIAAGLDFLCGDGLMLQPHQQQQQLGLELELAADGSSGAALVPGVWQPTAHRIAAACAATTSGRFFAGNGSSSNLLAELAGRSSSSSSSSSSAAGGLEQACGQLLLGQCQAVVNTLNVWFGVLMAVTVVALVERFNKWHFLHLSRGAAAALSQSLRVQDAPAAFKQSSRRRFMQQQLCCATVLLDVPLLLLWVALSRLYRPAAAVAALGGSDWTL